MKPELYASLLIIGAISAIFYSFISARGKYTINDKFNHIGIFLVATSPLVGMFTGTFYFHGFDIPWWLFGAFYALICVLFFSIGSLFIWVYRKYAST